LGINSIDLYARHFGLGQKTGLEIGESSGILAGPDYRKANGLTPWMDGDTLHAVIGQAEISFTPVQLATYVATIANNGVRLQTHLVSKITDYNRQNVVSQTEAKVVDNIGVSEQNLKIVQSDMRNVVVAGTASTTLGSYPIPIAAKTGTAEGAGNDNSIFVCYAPYDKPQIAIAVVLEHGVKGKFTQGVAKDIMDAYFYPQGTPAA
jgi:penicillin-binding protein 2